MKPKEYSKVPMLVEAMVAASAGPSEAHNSRCRFARRILVALAVSAVFTVSAGSAFADDVARGMQLAQQWCMGCHVLPDHPGQTALQGPPSFREIARGGKTPHQLHIFLLNPHGAMPPLTLSRAEIDDLIGYIETLR